MAKSSNQKLKILYLIDMFLENTDENHGLTMAEILSNLRDKGIWAERKSIYSDIEDLSNYGFDIIKESAHRNTYYYLASREFEVAELKLLVDAVQASKFIGENQTRQLIKKLEKQASKYEASNLQRQVYVVNRAKNDNKTILVNIDKIHEAINNNKSISFKYLEWTVEKKLKPRNEGKLYNVSPWALVWDDENYYMVAYDNEQYKTKHFRVDKMGNVNVLDLARQGKDIFSEFDQAKYAKKMFGMFGGEKKNVTLTMNNRLIGVAIDRFGKDIMLFADDNETFHFTTEVEVSEQFFGWVLGLGKNIKIKSPEGVVEKFKNYLSEIQKIY